MDGSCPWVPWDCCTQDPHSSLHKQRNPFSLEPNEIIITGTTGIIAASHYSATPLECMILFWLFFFLLGRWQIVLIMNSHSEISFNLNQLPSWRSSSRKHVHPAKHDYLILIMQQFTTQNNVFAITIVTVIAAYINKGNLLRTHVLLHTCWLQKKNQPWKSILLSSNQHILKCSCFLNKI